MNKKIFTLLAAGLMGGLSVNAITTNYTKGNLHQLTLGTGDDAKVLSVAKSKVTGGDSLVMVAPSTAVMSDNYKKSLWKITETKVDNTTTTVYTLTNYATGNVLSLDLSKTNGTVAAGQSNWLISDGGQITAIKGGDTYAIYVANVTNDDDEVVAADKVFVKKGATASSFAISQPAAIPAMTPNQINGLYGTSSSLKFTKSLDGNPIDGVAFNAVAIDDVNDYVNLRLSTGKYLVVDTTKWANSVNANEYWKLTTDALPTTEAADAAVKGGDNSTAKVLKNGRTAVTYQFKVSLDIAAGYVLTLTPKAVPNYVGDDDTKAKYFCYTSAETTRPLVYGQFASSTLVLTATKATDDKLNTATATFGPVSTPSELSKDYVYYVQDYNKYEYNDATEKWSKNPDYKKYGLVDCAGDIDVAKSAYPIPGYMWYLDEDGSLKNMLKTVEDITGFITLINEAEGLYAFGPDTLKLTKGPKVADAQKMAYKEVTKADEINGALSFRLVSALANDLFVVSKNGVLTVANADINDAQKLKVVTHLTGEDEDGNPAYATVDGSNGVIKPAYYITDRLGKKALAYDRYDDQFCLAAIDQDEDDIALEDEDLELAQVSFYATGVEDQYKIYVERYFSDDTPYDVAITANAATGILETTYKCDATKNNIFEFASKDAPMFGAPAYGHVQITTLEDDNKMIAPQLDGFAALKAEGQILKSDVYTNDTLKLWLDTAHVDDIMPLYYLSSSAFNEEGDLRNYLINPANISDAIDDYNANRDWDEEEIANNYPFTSVEESAFRAAFAPAAVCGEDSLAIGGDTIDIIPFDPAAIAFEVAAEVSDEAYYIVSNLKSVNPVYGTDDATDDTLPYNEEDASWYLAQLNNVLFWTQDANKAEVFVINRTTAPTANEAVEAETVKVIGGQGVVTVQGAAGKVITVANILGQTIANQVAASDNVTIAAPAGVVVVSVDGEATKVVVK